LRELALSPRTGTTTGRRGVMPALEIPVHFRFGRDAGLYGDMME
jgi:hypothetical protein